MSVRDYLVDAFYSLGAPINKRGGNSTDEVSEGVVGPRLPSLDLEMSDEDLIKLSDTWEKTWNESDVKAKWQSRGEENEKYWLGQHYNRPESDTTRPVQDNAIFQGLETYLPQVTRRNPEAMVELARSELQGTQPDEAISAKNDYAHAVQLELGELADEIHLRLKLKGVARNWSVRLLGVAKYSWDVDNNRPSMKVLRPTKVILDPSAVTDEDGYSGTRIGEHRKLSADKLLSFIEGEPGYEQNKQWIIQKTGDNMATEIDFIEWWTPDYFFWKVEKQVLKKRKNPHWNYDEEPALTSPDEPKDGLKDDGEQPEQQEGNAAPIPSIPENGQLPEGQEPPAQEPIAPAPEPRKGINHFAARRMPYLFLSVYNLGTQPVDQTSLIGQNLSNQDLINKRIKQIDKTSDSAIGGLVVSLARSGLTQRQASNVTKALRKNGVVAIPDGSPQDAVWKPPATELPVYVYNQLVDVRTRVMDVWGTRGTTPAGLQTEQTVRGKIQVQAMDTDRIGGGISEFLEQLADDSYNWFYQLLLVYDDRFTEALANGTPIPRLKISVKEGSLLPKDSTTMANQAMTLAQEGKMSNLDLYKALDYPNPKEMAANAWLEVNAPDVLYSDDPRIAQALQAKQQAAQAAEAAKNGGSKGPSESIAFKDLPPEGKVQMAEQAGIHLAVPTVAAHEAAQNLPPGAPPMPALSLGTPTQ